jgi:hypothetical protein
VALAEAEMQATDREGAAALLREAVDLQPAHPLPHLLRGHLLRQQGRLDEARHELAYETSTLQDVQAWAWQHFPATPPAALDVGNGLDLGFIQGFHAAEGAAGRDWRWTTHAAALRLAVPAAPAAPGSEATRACAAHDDAPALLRLHMASGRPAEASPPVVAVTAAGQPVGRVAVAPEWQRYTLPLPASVANAESVTVRLRSETFTPRDYAPASSDGRVLGVMLARAALVVCGASP